MKVFHYVILTCCFLWLTNHSKAQNLSYTLNTAGASTKINNEFYDFNIGEMILIQTFQTNQIMISQGFLQPFLVTQTVADLSVENNFLTPNGDGKNDFFVVKGLEKYPENKLTIFDRGGRTIYSVLNYQNTWDGYLNGKPLMEDTYYYILDLGKNGTIKGFLSILYKK